MPRLIVCYETNTRLSYHFSMRAVRWVVVVYGHAITLQRWGFRGANTARARSRTYASRASSSRITTALNRAIRQSWTPWILILTRINCRVPRFPDHLCSRLNDASNEKVWMSVNDELPYYDDRLSSFEHHPVGLIQLVSEHQYATRALHM